MFSNLIWSFSLILDLLIEKGFCEDMLLRRPLSLWSSAAVKALCLESSLAEVLKPESYLFTCIGFEMFKIFLDSLTEV